MIEDDSELRLINETSNDHGINGLNIEFNAKYVESSIQSILSLKNSLNYFSMSYEAIINLINKDCFYTEEMKAFLSSVPQLFEVFSTINEDMIRLFPEIKQDTLIKGASEGQFFKKGCALFYKKQFYQGVFNQKNFEFKGVFLPDINKPIINIGLISKGVFEGIAMSKEENGSIRKTVYTSTYQAELNDEQDEVSFFSICEPKEVYSFKERAFLLMENNREFINNCYYYLANRLIVSFKIGQEETMESKPITLLYDSNHLYIGMIKGFKRNGEGSYYIRRKNAEEDEEMALYLIEGAFENNDVIKGKVFKGESLLFDGEFEKNQPRKGVYYYSDKEFYQGEIKDNQLEGKGEYVYENGDKFRGIFKNSVPFFGDLTDSLGTIKDIQITNEMLIWNKKKSIELEIK